jgi:hypothetical protein
MFVQSLSGFFYLSVQVYTWILCRQANNNDLCMSFVRGDFYSKV